jgi:uracil-DNA glycosylase
MGYRLPPLPPSWRAVLGPELSQPYFTELARFLEDESARAMIHPDAEHVFAALHTPFDRVKVVLLGQDPYHGEGQAHGLALSVPPGQKAPPSLANMLKELGADLGCDPPTGGCLLPWAEQGVLLLNAVLTVRHGEAGSHQKKGWERFTDATLSALAERERPVVFALWGNLAKKKAKLVTAPRHRMLEGVHPSPLSAHGGFFGSKPYSRINAALAELGESPIDWKKIG